MVSRGFSWKIVAILCSVCAGAAFFIGWHVASTGAIEYTVDGVKCVVAPDIPTYGLPVVEYSELLFGWRKGLTDQTLSRAETFLDFALEDAMYRRPVLPDEARKILDKSLVKVARYREKYP